MSKPKIGFIGVGIMGFPMAKNLLKAGYSLIAFDLNQKALNEITQEGAKQAESCAQVTTHSDVIITMLPNSPDVQQAVLGEKGILEGASEGQILI